MIVARGLGRDVDTLGALVCFGLGVLGLAQIVEAVRKRTRTIWIFKESSDLAVTMAPTSQTDELWIKK